MHQYAGNPGNYPVTVGFIDDSDAPNASNFNTAPQGLADRSAYLTVRVALAGWDWQPRLNLKSLFASSVWGGCAFWAAAINQWLLAASETVGGEVLMYSSYGLEGDDTTISNPGGGLSEEWVQIGSGTVYGPAGNCAARACAIDPDGTAFWCAVESFGPQQMNIQFTTAFNAGWTNKRVVSLASSQVAMTVFNGQLIYLTSQGIISSTANHGSTWSDFNTGLGTNGPTVAQNATVCCFASGLFIWSSSDGVTWAQNSISPGSHYEIVGIAWDPTRSLFVACVQHTTVPFTAEFWTSPDGITWTFSTFGPTAIWLVSFAILQGDWVCTLLDVVSGGPSGQVWSGDGGTTWFLGKATFPSAGASANALYGPSRLFASPVQLFCVNTLWARFSRLAGIPPTHL